MNRKTKIVLRIIVLVIVLGVVTYLMTPVPHTDKMFTITKGESTESIINRLADDGYIRNRLLFKLALAWSGSASKLQPGVYDLSQVESYSDVINRLSQPSNIRSEVTLLLKEGEDLRSLSNSLYKIGLSDKAVAELYKLTGRPAELRTVDSVFINELKQEYLFLNELPDGLGLEGFLFPDTYRFYSDAEASDVVHRMLDNFGRRVVPGNESGWTIPENSSLFEIIVMASILEREVQKTEDRQIVSDIFWRRLKAGMPLQADSTVNYIIDSDRPSATYQDIKINSPYNTYLQTGLPVGPISNPGLDAIKAAANPKPNNYWYFLTDSSGKVHYAQTFDEHITNRNLYLNN